MRKVYVIFALVALTSFLLAGSVFAAVTGKLNGTVRDAQSGEPLPGANVVIDGTQRGATTDVNGYYVILLVEPNTYRITASMVGYDAQSQTEVRIQSDHTSTVDFQIRETALALGELVVVAERPPVEPDKTTSKYILSSEDLDAVPIVRDMEHFMELQAGVSISPDGKDISIRGGDAGDVAYVVDGVRIVTTDHGGSNSDAASDIVSGDAGGFRTSQGRSVNKTSIQELTVITGGYGAEYGNAQGGVVSVVTRSGGQTFRGMGDYQFIPSGQKHWGKEVYDSPAHARKMKWDDADWIAATVALPKSDHLGKLSEQNVSAHGRQDYTSNLGHRTEGNLSGPLSKDATFFVSGKWGRVASPFPSADPVTPFNISLNGKVTVSATPNFKVRAGGLYNSSEGTVGGPWMGDPFIVNDQGLGKETDQMVYLGVTHSLSPKTFYELQVAMTSSKRTDDDRREAIVGEKLMSGGYTVYEDLPTYQRFSYKRQQIKGDLSSQVNRQHFVKVGFEAIAFNNWFQEFSFTGTNSRRTRFFAETFHSLDWLPGQSNSGLKPKEFGIYLQDKIEFEGMIVNAGVRLDYFSHASVALPSFAFFPSTMYMGLTQSKRAPQEKGWDPIIGFSPRLGVSHPITEKSIIRFFYGKFSQRPSFQDLFRSRHDSLHGQDRDDNGNGAVDPKEKFNDFWDYAFSPNPYLQPKSTTSFEVGMDYNFVSDYVLALTSYYKSTAIFRSGHAQYSDSVTGSYEKGQTHSWFPARYQDTRGIELSLRKKFSNMFAFNLAYNVQWSERMTFGTARFDRFADSLFLANGHFFVLYDIDPTSGEEIPVSLREQARREGRDDLDFHIKAAGTKQNKVYRDNQKRFGDWNNCCGGKGESSYIWAPQYSYFAAGGFQNWDPNYIPDSEKAPDWKPDQKDKDFWVMASNWPGHPGKGEANMLLRTDRRNSESRRPGDGDRRNFGSMTFLFATPASWGPLGGSALGNTRANLVYRLYSGTRYVYTPPGGAEGFRYGPMHTRMDLNAEKVFGDPAGVNITLAVEVYNLFNQRDVRDRRPTDKIKLIPGSGFSENLTPYDFVSDNYQQYGLTGLRPTHVDNKDLGLVEGALNDLTDFWDQPREMNFSVRVRF